MKHDIDLQYYPGWVRKAITFSNDDGNVPMDKKFLDIVRPAGILGTFNLCSHNISALPPEGYREMYRGYGIANHVKYHPFVLTPEKEKPLAQEPFRESTADPEKRYATDVPGLYRQAVARGWRYYAIPETYVRLVGECHRDLEALFGEGTVRGFVWSFSKQPDASVRAGIYALGYTDLRDSAKLEDSTSFALPTDRTDWNMNAIHTSLLRVAALYEAYPDDGQLKFFCFGMHSVDYEREDKWEDLRIFAGRYGNRPQDFYYAPVADIFDYEDAVKAVVQTENSLCNDTDIPLYLTVNGEKKTLSPHSTLTLG